MELRLTAVLLATVAMVAPAAAGGPDFNWAGPHVSVNGGAAWGTTNWNLTVPGFYLTTGNFSVSGAMLGGSVGYDLQRGHWIIGAIADIDWTSVYGNTAGAGQGECFPNCATSSSWFGTVRGRVGYADGPFLPYLTGGLAVGDASMYHVGKASGVTTSTLVGWTAGAGLQYALSRQWSFWVEYLYADLGNASCGAFVCDNGVVSHEPVDRDIIRVGLDRRW
jgi:outer membrane immunogenic protein